MNLQRLIAEVEINISPLQNNLFTNCKSELKYFEAAIAGTITVATPTYAFSRAIVDGENGFLAKAYRLGRQAAGRLRSGRQSGAIRGYGGAWV